MKKSTLMTWLTMALGIISLFVLFLPAVANSAGLKNYSVYELTFNEFNPRGGLVTAWIFLLTAALISILVAVLSNVLGAKMGAAYVSIVNIPFYITSCVLYFCTYVFANKLHPYYLGLGAILAGSFSAICVILLVLNVVFSILEKGEEAK